MLICAVVITFLLYHVSLNSKQWEQPRPPPSSFDKPALRPNPKPYQPQPHANTDTNNNNDNNNNNNNHADDPAPYKNEPPVYIPQLKTSNEVKGGYALPTAVKAPANEPPAPSLPAAIDLPDRVVDAVPPPGKQGVPAAVVDDKATRWKKPKEWFPVPTESIIPLPTGKPKAIPRVQFSFGHEAPAAKEKREARLAQVKAEAALAWSGYKKYAWTHDELMPVSKGAKDPFCGWAATLVDSLDTLWIMGMRDEFDDAVQAAKAIDFTTTPYRNDIPVFETTIRYLGGFLGAYDVSGGHEGKYRVLLDKAEELADILMGVFDTPNRMPILYYYWQPSSNLSPKRASSSSGVAELGTLSMEFTRLAQLTGKDKYYDAVARITDALDDLQSRPHGTALPGIFPEQVDASGCNRTAQSLQSLKRSSDAAQAQAGSADLSADPVGYSPRGIAKRQYASGQLSDAAPTAKGLPADWECVPQGLTGGSHGYGTYSMGGSQDSAYEYFSKQYALLGGLEPKYRDMHVRTVDGVKKYLLFRPMAVGDPDILFSAKATSSDGTDQALSYEWEVTHLTCFLGGMFGLGGRMFDRPEDVEIGKKLADGCAWAYEVMPTGIMPEYASVMPCAKADDCHWNETKWHEQLDSQASYRRNQMREYEDKKAEWDKEVAEIKAKAAKAAKRQQEDKDKRDDQGAADGWVVVPDKQAEGEGARGNDNLGKRSGLNRAALEMLGNDNKGDDGQDASFSAPPQGTAGRIEAKVQQLESELAVNDRAGRRAESGVAAAAAGDQKPLQQEQEFTLPPEPRKPQSHEEYIKSFLERERLPGGFSRLNDKRYILRYVSFPLVPNQ